MSKKVKTTPRLKIVAIAEDEAVGEFRAVIKFHKIDGTTGTIIQPRSSLREPHKLLTVLDDVGAALPINQSKAIKLVQSLKSAAQNARRWRYAPKTGWHKDKHRAFVHPVRVYGNPRSASRIKPPLSRRSAHNRKLHIKGTHRDWMNGVALPAKYSSRMVLAICAALAAALLHFLDVNSFGLHFWKKSKIGKSTLPLATGSVIGFRKERDLLNFRITDPAFGEILPAFNDMIAPINELGLLRGSTTDRNQRLREMAYLLGEGRGITYSKLAKLQPNSSGSTFRCIVLSTGEELIADIYSATGDTQMTGACLRWFDLNAAHRGESDIFDLNKHKKTGSARAKWVSEQCRAIRRACRSNPGVAFDHFIRNVIANSRTIGTDLLQMVDGFTARTATEYDDQAIRHLAMYFGIFGAAGVLGVRFGTIPWSEKLVWKCVKRCFLEAKRGLRTEPVLLQNGLATLRRNLSGQRMIDLNATAEPSESQWRKCDGYIDGDRATVRADQFKRWFKDRRELMLVLRWLHSQRVLTAKTMPPTTTKSKIVWAESQPKWPNGKRPRSIVFGLRNAGRLPRRIARNCQRNTAKARQSEPS